MKKGIIVEHTLIDNFDGMDIHKRDELSPNTIVEIIDHYIVYGISYTKIRYKDKTGYIDSRCIVEIQE